MAPTVKAVNPPSNLPILPGPSQRKQNLACDSCRKRKVRCLRTEKTQICQQCSNKGEECTNLYIDSLAQAKNKKVRKSSHENIANDMDTVQKAKKRLNSNKKRLISSQNLRLTQMDTEDQSRMHDHEDRRRRNSANTVISTYDPGESSRQGSMTMTRNNSMDSLQQASNVALPDPYIVPQDIVQDPMSFSCHATNIPDLSTLTPDVTQRDMIKYLFAPLAIVNLEYGYNDVSSLSMCKDGKSDLWEEQDGKIWYEQPSEIHKSLDEEAIKDLVDDLIDTFFSIVQPRYTMIDSTLFRERFAMGSNHRLGNISHALLAIVLTYGARFSDHPVLQADGEECSLRDGVHMKNRNRSRLVGLMVIRTREIAERSKIFRVASMENTHSCFLLEHLLGQVINLGTKHYQNIYLSAAVKHLITMDLNTSAKWTEIQDNDLRTEALSLLWIVRMSDASRAALYRLKPSLSAEHFDVDPVQHAMLSEGAPMMQPLGGTEHNIIDQATWFKIHHTFCSICYTLAKSLWIPSISARGIPFTILREFIHSSSIWRDKYLSSIGIPTIWPEHWDFLQAITTCTTDCYYHVLWLLIYKAINDFGIKEEKSILEKNDSNKFEIENIKRRIKEEAEHAALRIAALTGVLTENGYLKLDPLIINQPIFLAGEYLASLGKSEYLICVAGLKQYSVIYPSLWDQADLLDQIYSQAKVNIFDQMQTINNENANSLLIGVVNETTTNHPDEGGQLNLNLDLNMGTMNIPPRLDLMSSFEDWTGSLGSIPSFNNQAISQSVHSEGMVNANNSSNQVLEDFETGPIAQKDPLNVEHWLGW